MEEIRYRSYGAGFQDLEMVNVRKLSENRTRYMGRSDLHPSWAPYPMKHMKSTRQCGDLQVRVGGMKTRKERSSSTQKKLLWNDPEIKRRGRVARYKLYGAEGKMKRSLKKGFRWFKRKCLQIVRTI